MEVLCHVEEAAVNKQVKFDTFHISSSQLQGHFPRFYQSLWCNI